MSMCYTKSSHPAFPCPEGTEPATVSSGMTMREWYAGMALAGIAYVSPPPIGAEDAAILADSAFTIADAMLEREQKADFVGNCYCNVNFWLCKRVSTNAVGPAFTTETRPL